MDDIESLNKKIEALQKENDHLYKEVQELQLDRSSVRISHEEQADYQESQVRFRTIFESSNLGNKVISSDLKILQLNAAMVELLGYDNKEDIIGTRILDYAPEEFHEHWLLLQKKLWKTNMPSFTLETCLKKKDGSIVWCQVNSILFKDHGKTLGYTTVEDITQQHILLTQKEEFISVASHELKTPVTSLKASIQLIRKLMKPGIIVTDKLAYLTDTATASVVRLTHLIDDLLRTTKFEQGQLSLNSRWFEIGDLIDSCCDHVSLQGKH
ncbi:MAG: PAS domain S-box protein [Pedobacter sp.]